MTGVSEALTRTRRAAPSSDRRGQVIVFILLTAAVLVGTAAWVLHHQTSVDIVVSGASPARGITLEAEYAPALPATITGASITTDAGTTTEASLYDNSTDSDAPPSSVAVRIGRSVSIYVSITPDCRVQNPSDQVTVKVETTAGERTLHAAVDGFGQAFRRICTGPVQLALSQAHRDGDLVTGTYVTAPIGERVTLSLRGTGFTADPIVLEPGSSQVQWTISTVKGCSVATEAVLAIATYDSGRQAPVHMAAPGRQVCGGG